MSCTAARRTRYCRGAWSDRPNVAAEQEFAHGKKLPPVHPGDILREEFLVPLKLTPYAVAAALKVPRTPMSTFPRKQTSVG
jgi:hypothetical protein